MNNTNVVHQLKILKVNDYAVSGSVIKSRTNRRYTGGGAGTAGSAERFGPALNFSLLLSFLSREKKVNERLK